MKCGDSATLTRTLTTDAIRHWQSLSGLPQIDEINGPGPLVAAMFSYLLGVELPGPGTNYLKQDISWLAPVPGDVPLTATVTITRLRPEKHLVDLETICTGPDGSRICEGRALVYVEDVGKA